MSRVRARRGQQIHESKIRPLVEAGNRVRFVVLDIPAGDHDFADTELAATRRVLERVPDGIFYGVRVGCPTAYHT